MTPKQIIYPVHAVGRLTERQFTRQMIRRVLATEVRRKALTLAGAQRRESRGEIGHRALSVIYIENAKTILIVTATWEN